LQKLTLQTDCRDVAPTHAARRPSLFVFYHYLYPDNVVSALHLDGLCEGMVDRGWSVTAFPSNRGCRDESLEYATQEVHKGVDLRRLWRPRLRQSSMFGRLLNALWMLVAWSSIALRPHPPDAILIGTDPILSVVIVFAWKLFRRSTAIAHWCFDLYPEAAYADGLLPRNRLTRSILEPLLRRAYASCDVIIDIGPCMRERLEHYAPVVLGEKAGAEHSRRHATIPPWALEEPPSVLDMPRLERQRIFGDARLAMLYSGSFGRAHSYDLLLELARHLRSESAALAFSVRGNREEELRSAVASADPDTICPICFVPFAPAGKLLDRLASADIHLLSLAPSWTGLVVPSKFFGVLAVGRPVLFSGSPQSAVAQWIEEHRLGWVLTRENVQSVALDLCRYVNDPDRVRDLNRRCHATYAKLFSRAASLDRMHRLFSGLVAERGTHRPTSSRRQPK